MFNQLLILYFLVPSKMLNIQKCAEILKSKIAKIGNRGRNFFFLGRAETLVEDHRNVRSAPKTRKGAGLATPGPITRVPRALTRTSLALHVRRHFPRDLRKLDGIFSNENARMTTLDLRTSRNCSNRTLLHRRLS